MCQRAEATSRKAARGSQSAGEGDTSGLTDKVLWFFPSDALNLPDRNWKLYVLSYVDDISKTIFPIYIRKFHLEFKN